MQLEKETDRLMSPVCWQLQNHLFEVDVAPAYQQCQCTVQEELWSLDPQQPIQQLSNPSRAAVLVKVHPRSNRWKNISAHCSNCCSIPNKQQTAYLKITGPNPNKLTAEVEKKNYIDDFWKQSYQFWFYIDVAPGKYYFKAETFRSFVLY